MLQQRVDGLLIVPVSDASRIHLNRLDRHGTPYVLIDRSVAGVEADVVQGDSLGGARKLIEHLIGLGHTKIAMIAESESVSTSRERRRRYRDPLDAAGLPCLPELMVDATVDMQGGYTG